MLSLAALETLMEPESSNDNVMQALEHLQLEHIDLNVLSRSIERLRESAGIKRELDLELRELGRFSIDCAGTGGSGLAHFNVSTSVAFVLASAGFKVAKFGGRAASGKSGSFDFLELLGIGSNLQLHECADALSVCGVAFIFAPQVYPDLKRLVSLRKQFGRPTLLNYIGPLLNPLRPAVRLMGVSSDRARHLIAEHLSKDSTIKRAILVTAAGRLDEFALEVPSYFSFINAEAGLKEYVLNPAEFPDIAVARLDGEAPPILPDALNAIAQIELDAASNFKIFNAIVEGDDTSSAQYRMLLLNTAAALKALKACSTFSEGVSIATGIIADGAVKERLSTCRRFYAKLSS